MPKKWGGWGLKNTFSFSKALVVKVGWRLLSIDSLLIEVIYRKYISPISIEERMRILKKSMKNVSFLWNVVLSFSSVIEKRLA